MHDAFALEEVVSLDKAPSALLHTSNALFVGFEDGSLHRYVLSSSGSDAPPKATLELSVSSLAKGTASSSTAGLPIASLALIKETSSLAVLCGGDVALYDIATLNLQTACERWTKGQAGSVWIDTSVLRQDARGHYIVEQQHQQQRSAGPNRRAPSLLEQAVSSSPNRGSTRIGRASKAASVVELASPSEYSQSGVPVIMTILAIPCRRRLILFSWRDGQWVEPREVALPHQARSICFPSPLKLFIGYSTAEYATLTLPTSTSPYAQPTLSEPFGPPLPALPQPSSSKAETTPQPAPQTSPATGSAFSVPSFSGLAARTGNLVSLGLGQAGKVSRNPVVRVGNRANEVICVRDASVIFMTSDGKQSRLGGITYLSPPEETIVAGPYVLSSQSGSTAMVQVHAVPSLQQVQTVELPQPPRPLDDASGDGPAKKRQSLPPIPPVRLLTSAANGRAPVFLASASGFLPGKTALLMLSMRPWAEQADEMTAAGDYKEALALLSDVDLVSLPDKAERVAKLETLAAVRVFLSGAFDDAIDAFITLETSPAKVLALYPERVSGKFEVSKEEWEELFGGRKKAAVRAAVAVDIEEPPRPASPKSSVASGDDANSVRSLPSAPATQRQTLREQTSIRSLNKPVDEFRASVDNLVRFLTDRRQNVNRALSAIPKPLAKLRSEVAAHPRPVAALLAMPDVPVAQLSEVELALVAEVIDTALFRCYLATKPSMLGPLCRLENWCRVDEVEALLMEAKRYHELLDLYHGKGLHDRALKLLHTMSEDEKEPEERVRPTVRYLQKLGPAHLDLILATSRWVLKADRRAGLEIFTADLGAVESLPRHTVAKSLEREDALACIGYLEHVIDALGEQGPDMHEKLAGLYISQCSRIRQQGDNDEAAALYKKLLTFLRTSTQYSPEWILARLPPDALYEARALTLGRMGRHAAALAIYVQRLNDPVTAEEYCNTVYASSPAIYLTLLRIYLRPSSDDDGDDAPTEAHFEAALRLIADHGARIDAPSALELLPPLVRLSDVAVFLTKALRTEVEGARSVEVTKAAYRARLDQLERGKMGLEERRVKIDDARTCVVCGKRFGNSVIAVHSPSGEVTHYQCRDRLRPTHARRLAVSI